MGRIKPETVSPGKSPWVIFLHLACLFFFFLIDVDDGKSRYPTIKRSHSSSLCFARRIREDVWSASQNVLTGSLKKPLAFAVPTHPPTFHFTLEVLWAHFLHPEQFDLFLIFTTPEDAALYLEFLSHVPRQQPNASFELPQDSRGSSGMPTWEELYQPLVLQWPCHSSVDLADRKVIITSKKLYALALLHACYDVIVTMDSEFSVIRPAQVQRAVLEAASSTVALAAYVPGYADMLLASVAMFPSQDLEAVREITRDFGLWTWWNDAPFYLSRDVPTFLRYIDFPARIPQAFNEFEHLTYTMWRVLHRNVTLVNLMDVAPDLDGPFGNTASPKHYEAAASISPPGPVWMTLHFCKSNPTLCREKESIVMIHHTDRGSTPWWRSQWDEGHMPSTVEDAFFPTCPTAESTRFLTPPSLTPRKSSNSPSLGE